MKKIKSKIIEHPRGKVARMDTIIVNGKAIGGTVTPLGQK